MRQTVLSVVLDVEPQSAQRLSGLIEQFKHDQEQGKQSYIRLMEEVPALHFLSMSVFENAEIRPDLRHRGEFRRTAGPLLGPDGGGVRHPASADAALLQASRRMATDRSTTPSPSPFRAIRSLLTSRRGRCVPASSIRATAAWGVIASCRKASSSWRPAMRWPNPARPNPIPIAASPPRRFTASCAPSCLAAFPGWRHRRRRAFPGPNG